MSVEFFALNADVVLNQAIGTAKIVEVWFIIMQIISRPHLGTVAIAVQMEYQSIRIYFSGWRPLYL